MADDTINRTYQMESKALEMLEEMRWQDRKSYSELINWLIYQEWTRRAAQPITQHEPQS